MFSYIFLILSRMSFTSSAGFGCSSCVGGAVASLSLRRRFVGGPAGQGPGRALLCRGRGVGSSSSSMLCLCLWNPISCSLLFLSLYIRCISV